MYASKKYAKLNDKEWLEKEYCQKRRSTVAIAKELGAGASTVTVALERFGIARNRAYFKYAQLADKNWLYEKYAVEKLSAPEISAIIGCSDNRCWAAIKQHGIETRQSLLFDGERKQCHFCHISLPAKMFQKNNRTPDGLSHYCKNCLALRSKNLNVRLRVHVLSLISKRDIRCVCCAERIYEFLAINHMHGGGNKHKKENPNLHLARWVMENSFPSGFNILCHNCNSSYGSYGYCPHGNSKERENKCLSPQSRRLSNERKYAIEHYGNKCACCGNSAYEHLAIDHISGGGTAHAVKYKKQGLRIAGWLRRNKYPDGFRVLCHNCNLARGIYGYCPHESGLTVDIKNVGPYNSGQAKWGKGKPNRFDIPMKKIL